MEKIALVVCDCTENHSEFPETHYTFPNLGVIDLPYLCLSSGLTADELSKRFNNLIKVHISNTDATNYSIYMAQISRIEKNLYFYSLGDVDEIGENNFYIKGELTTVVNELIAELGEIGSEMSKFLKNQTLRSNSTTFNDGLIRPWKVYFGEIKNNLSDDLELGIYCNLLDSELTSILSNTKEG
jgi:hypothetical protein